jgi:acyl-CoA synthetase (AMP-forming)/AMP-acid ligase II
MRGYWRDPVQTAAAITPEGWCRTGDVGVRDRAGSIRVVDRLKDAYNCGGFSAFPAEIENQLLEWGAIAQVAVVGVPDERLGVGHASCSGGGRWSTPRPDRWSREHGELQGSAVHVVDAFR